jgi:MFS family permease
MDTAMYIYLGFCAVIALGASFLATAIFASMIAAEAGKWWMLFWSGVFALIPGSLGAMVGSVTGPYDSIWGIVIGGGILYLVSIAGGIGIALSAPDMKRYVLEAPLVKEFFLKNFDALRSEKQDLITEPALETALANESWTAGQRHLIEHVLTDMSEVGHVIDSKTVSGLTVIPTGGAMLMMPTSRTKRVYGISKADLETYPERRQKKWQKWLDATTEG